MSQKGANYSQTIKIILFGCVILLTIFIFLNSGRNYTASHDSSQQITSIIVSDTKMPAETVEILVRKSAHLLEFALLGAAVLCLTKEIFKTRGINNLAFAYFYVLAVAVVDEHIQSFSDRTSSTHDILLDFVGALIGFSVVWLVMKIYKVIKRQNK